MRNVMTIARRELKAYFNSPIAYIVIVVFLAISGSMFFFFGPLFLAQQASMRYFFAVTPLLLVIFAPAVSMRLVAEELRSGTLELLTTLPVRDHEVILGKFLAGLTVICSALAMTLVYAFTVSSIGDLDWGPVIGGYLGLVLCAAALIGIGLMTSAWSRNQIIAFIFALLICLTLWLLDKITFFVPAGMSAVLEFLSIDFHFHNIARGVIDSRDLLYYLSLTAIALYGAVRSLGRHHA
jgi:ABC-2 type transport system permease protein